MQLIEVLKIGMHTCWNLLSDASECILEKNPFSCRLSVSSSIEISSSLDSYSISQLSSLTFIRFCHAVLSSWLLVQNAICLEIRKELRYFKKKNTYCVLLCLIRKSDMYKILVVLWLQVVSVYIWSVCDDSFKQHFISFKVAECVCTVCLWIR